MNNKSREIIAEKLLREAGRVFEEYYRQTFDEVITDLRIRCLIDKDAKSSISILHGLHFSKMFYQFNNAPVIYVRNAIARFVEGTFGFCRECGEKIQSEWLMKSPLIEYCSSCMVKMSPFQESMKRRRKIEDPVWE